MKSRREKTGGPHAEPDSVTVEGPLASGHVRKPDRQAELHVQPIYDMIAALVRLPGENDDR